MSMKSTSRPPTTGSHASNASHVTGRTATQSQRTASVANNVIMENTGGDFYARKALMFTGPDNVRDHRVAVVQDPLFIGEAGRSQEVTSAVSYMFRPSPSASFPLAKNGRIGEIGWNQEHFGTKKY